MSNESAIVELCKIPTPTRDHAVACALELIKADIMSSSPSGTLDKHLRNLSMYAEKIEKALKVKS
ncbi:hypothetical protein [Vibrio sp. H11]|uniref:hypothetical protein n=1 Tax=Vibrio sp. H11 TaxID=2565928 RepID=UPI0010A5F8AB|nr:hypothetical protein [Vibrio sp. H11]